MYVPSASGRQRQQRRGRRAAEAGRQRRRRVGEAELLPLAGLRVERRQLLPVELAVGLAERVERLAVAVEEGVAVGQQVHARVQRQVVVGAGREDVPLARRRVVLLDRLDVGARVLRMVGVDRLDQLADAGEVQVGAVALLEQRRVPAAAARVARLGEGVGLRVVDARRLEARELDRAEGDAVDARVQRVVRAALDQDAPVGQERLVRAEQRAVVVGLGGLAAGDQRLARVAVRVGAAVEGLRRRPGEVRVVLAQVEHAGGVVGEGLAALGDDGEAVVLRALQRVPVDDLAVGERRQRARGRLADEALADVRVRRRALDALLVGRLAVDGRLRARRAELAVGRGPALGRADLRRQHLDLDEVGRRLDLVEAEPVRRFVRRGPERAGQAADRQHRSHRSACTRHLASPAFGGTPLTRRQPLLPVQVPVIRITTTLPTRPLDP